MSTCTRSGRVSVLCWGWISHDGAGMLHRIDGHLDSLQYKHILQNMMVPSVRMLYPDYIIHFQQDYSSIHVIVWFKNGYRCRPTSNLLTGRCRKPSLSSLPERAMSCGHLCQTRGMKLLRLNVTFDRRLSPLHDELNQWSKHRGPGLPIKEVSF